VCEETTKAGPVLTITVDNARKSTFGVLVVLVDYPEDLVFIPGAADDTEVQSAVSERPTAGAPQCVINDRDDRVQVGCLSVGGFPAGRFFRVALRECAKKDRPSLESFTCTVIEAADTQAHELPATCTLTLS
jgi:hypothetical protein